MIRYKARIDDIVIYLDGLHTSSEIDPEDQFKNLLYRGHHSDTDDGETDYFKKITGRGNRLSTFDPYEYIIIANNSRDCRSGTLIDLDESEDIAYKGKYLIKNIADNEVCTIQHLRTGWLVRMLFANLVTLPGDGAVTLDKYLADLDDTFVFIRRARRIILEELESQRTCSGCDEIQEDHEVAHMRQNSSGPNEFFCSPCASEISFECWICEDTHQLSDRDRYHYTRNKYVCAICYMEKIFDCSNCGMKRMSEGGGNRYGSLLYCDDCYDSAVVSSLSNPPSSVGYVNIGRIYSGKENSFKTNRSRTVTSIEIELIHDEEYDPENLPSGFSCEYDGSLSHGGQEFIMNPTLGDDVGYKLESICRWAEDADFYPDKSCGIHVHTNALDMGVSELKGMLIIMRKMENYIYKMIPPERKNKRYSRKMADYDVEKLLSVKTPSDLCRFWYNTMSNVIPSTQKYNESRYRGFNLHARFLLGTLEYRYHEGSRDFERIYNWTKFCLGLTEFGKTLMDRDKRLIDAFVDDTDKGLDWYLSVMDMSYLEKYLSSRIDQFRAERKEYEEQHDVERTITELFSTDNNVLRHELRLSRQNPFSPSDN